MNGHRRIKITSLPIAVIALILSGGLLYTSRLPQIFSASGTVVSLPNPMEGRGFRADFEILRPFRERTFRIANLPTDMQSVGTRIEGQFQINDVIGTGTWDVVIEPISVIIVR